MNLAWHRGEYKLFFSVGSKVSLWQLCFNPTDSKEHMGGSGDAGALGLTHHRL